MFLGNIKITAVIMATILLLAAGFSIADDALRGLTKGRDLQTDVITSVPRTMTYQGILKNSNGVPMPHNPDDIVFRIYNDPDFGDELWSDTVSIVTDANGIFTAELSGLDIPFDVDYWLELEVAGEILSPRQKLHMSAYAARADTAEFAVSPSGGWVDDGAVVRLETASDKVGIGTSTPANRVHITGSENDPLLFVHKTGSGRGMKVSADSACAIWVEDAGNHGLRVTQADGNGVNIEHANNDGIHVDSAGNWAGYFHGKGYFGDNVGIGMETPDYKLDVLGTVGIDVGANYGDVPLTIDVPSNQSATIFRIAKGGSIINVVDSSGNVGIGTFNPAEKLDVAGTASISGFKMTTGASSGYVLTSDAFGNGTWQALPSAVNADAIEQLESKIGDMMNIIEVQNQKIEQLEDRIAAIQNGQE